MTMTLRDDVWTKALTEIVENGNLRISDLGLDDGDEHTARRVLREMVDHGWLEQDSRRAAIYERGELADEYLQPTK